MTNEEAINELKEIRFNENIRINGTSYFDEALSMAIKALEAQDTRSITLSIDERVFKKLTDEAVQEAVEEIRQEMLCGDAISREAALDIETTVCRGISCENCLFREDGKHCKWIRFIKFLPSVIPKPEEV